MSDPEHDNRWADHFPTFLRAKGWLCDGPPIRFVGRTWRRVLKWAALVLLVCGVLHIIVSVHTSSRLNAKLLALETAGKPVATWDLKPPTVPDDQNAAPLYTAAAAWAKLHDRAGGWDPSVPPGAASTLTVGYGDIITSRNKLRDLTPDQFQCLSRLVAVDRPALDLVRDAARRPHCRFKRNWQSYLEVDPTRSVPHNLLRFLAANVLVAARSEEHDQALEYLRLGFVVSRHTAEEPTLIAGLGAARGTAHTMMVAAARVLPDLHPSSRAAQALADELSQANLGSTLVERWDHERCTGLYLFATVDSPENVGYVMGSGAAPVPEALEPMFWRQYLGGLLQPWLDLDEVFYLDQTERWDEMLAASPRDRAAAWRSIPESAPDPPAPWWAPMTRLTYWQPVGWARILDCWDVSCDLLRVVLGLEVYRREHGSYPQSLQALRASGWDVPLDRFTEQDFVYKPRGASFLLYSVGLNLQDDGGELGEWPFYTHPTSPRESPSGDIVWETGSGTVSVSAGANGS